MRRLLLVGNGLSIAAHAGFRLDTLSAAVATRLEGELVGGQTLRHRLQTIATQLEADGQQSAHAGNFERLLGPLDRLRSVLSTGLASTLAAVRPDLAVPIHEIGGEVTRLYTRGVGAVLSEIDALAVQANLQPVEVIARWATGYLADDDQLSIYTLNYDPLLDRTLLDLATTFHQNGVTNINFRLADDFSGREADKFEAMLFPAGAPLVLHAQRSEALKRTRPVDLIHLHGGQHWVRLPSGLVYKSSSLNDLRNAHVYEKWTHGDPVDASPAVVLTDQKGKTVSDSPFVEGYRHLRHDLTLADRVAIVGYGFGDVPLNEVLADGLAHAPVGGRWLVNRRPGARPDEETEARIETANALGVDPGDCPAIVFQDLPGITQTNAAFYTAA